MAEGETELTIHERQSRIENYLMEIDTRLRSMEAYAVKHRHESSTGKPYLLVENI